MENIIENNQCIAEFLGYQYVPALHNEKAYYWYQSDMYPIDLFLYHKDWFFLMIAVEKIQSMGFDVWIMYANYNGSPTNQCGITEMFTKTKHVHIAEQSDNKLEAVYNAVVRFCKCYATSPYILDYYESWKQ